MRRLFSTEQVSKYHPDKYADQISDALLSAYLKGDKFSHCGIEALAKNDTVIVSGEVGSSANVDTKAVADKVAEKLGYRIDRFINLISRQSAEICKAVNSQEDIGAGDQGMMFGYATRETESRMPYGFATANEIIRILEEAVENDVILIGDAKTQVTVDLSKKGVDSLDTIVVSALHTPFASISDVRQHITDVLADHMDIGKARLIINPAGSWCVGGPTADCGLTGRKIVADQYGGYCPVGGGAFSGKDPTKVDRSGSYMARKIACDLLDKFDDMTSVSVQLAYAIGIPEPVSVSVTQRGCRDYTFEHYVRESYDLTPRGIIESLDLLNKDYEKIAEGCHYRPRNGL